MRRNSIHEPPEMSDVHIMLLGLTGSGKSASGNTIIGVRGTFKEDFSPVAVSRTCESAQTEVNGQTITVIDTVGLSDTSVKITDAQTEIERMLQSTNIDVFLLVIKLSETFTVENSKVVQWIQENFGAKFLKHTIVLFTHGDQLHEPIEKYLSESETLQSVVDQCSGCYVFDNKDEDPSQVTELMEKIELLRKKNGNRRYTEQDYKENQDKILHRKYRTTTAVGGAVGGIGAAAAAAAAIAGTLGGAASGGAVGVGAAASTIGTAAFTAGHAALIGAAALLGAAGGAVLAAAAAVGAGKYLFARKYNSREKDK